VGAGTDIILANTYHLMIQPGADRVKRLGGLHKMMNWEGPMLTDSGGFQILSLGGQKDSADGDDAHKSLTDLSEEGATFKSYRDGQKMFLSPEKSIQIQHKLGADLIVQLDECTPHHVDHDYTTKSMEMSLRWGQRCLDEFDRLNDGTQAMYGVIQGGVFDDLRQQSSEAVSDQGFFGLAIGGPLGMGVDGADLDAVVDMCVPYVDRSKPMHLLGIGGIRDILDNVIKGMDTFDCVTPTRLARHGAALIKGRGEDHVNLRNAPYKDSTDPVDDTCGCHTCQHFSTGYINHLIRAHEPLAAQLISIHNIFTMNRLMSDIRQAFKQGTMTQTRSEWLGP
jgi:queuine tRNA-ribosyltransferase